MNKTFYFQHDYTASSDKKILFLRHQLGMEGYGIYWYLIEQLALSNGVLPLDLIPILASQMQVSDSKINSVINDFGLFDLSNNEFTSSRLCKHLEHRDRLSMAGKKAAQNRWRNKEPNATVMRPHSDRNAKERKGKERIGEEKKGYEIDIYSDFCLFIQAINQKLSRAYKSGMDSKSYKAYCARRKNYSDDELLQVFQNIFLDDWHKSKNHEMVTPEYCLRETMVEKFLNINTHE